MIYAGIGSRETPKDILDLMYLIGYFMALEGHECATGACIGPDQAFANGAIAAGGIVHINLPWWSYEQAWVKSLPQNKVSIRVINDTDVAAYQSVDTFHPAPQRLKQSVRKLHARNYLILQTTQKVICYTNKGLVTGGTGQGIRIAKQFGQIIHNLGTRDIHQQYLAWINNCQLTLLPNGE